MSKKLIILLSLWVIPIIEASNFATIGIAATAETPFSDPWQAYEFLTSITKSLVNEGDQVYKNTSKTIISLSAATIAECTPLYFDFILSELNRTKKNKTFSNFLEEAGKDIMLCSNAVFTFSVYLLGNAENAFLLRKELEQYSNTLKTVASYVSHLPKQLPAIVDLPGDIALITQKANNQKKKLIQFWHLARLLHPIIIQIVQEARDKADKIAAKVLCLPEGKLDEDILFITTRKFLPSTSLLTTSIPSLSGP